MASIEPRKNKDGIITSYTIRVSRGRDANGKKLKQFTRTYPDKSRGESIPKNWSQARIEKEVNRIAALFEEECRRGNVTVGKITFSEYALKMLENKKANNLNKRSTLSTAIFTILPKINDVTLNGFGHMELDKITVGHINKFYATLLDEKYKANNNTGGALAPSSIHRFQSFISSVFSYACSEQILRFNPCSYVILPKIEDTPADTIKEEDLSLILAIIEAQELWVKAALYILFTSGCRIGELAGIQWKDVNFDTNIVELRNNVQYNKNPETGKNSIYVDTLKANGSRSVIISAYTAEVLKAYAKERGIVKTKICSNFIFNTGDGDKPMNPDLIRKRIYKLKYYGAIKKPVDIQFYNHTTKREEIIKYQQGDVVRFTPQKVEGENNTELYKIVIDNVKNNYAYISCEYVEIIPEHLYPHKFRHTCASMLIFENLDLVTISKHLGHKKPTTTAKIYAHAFKTVDERPANIFDKVINQNR